MKRKRLKAVSKPPGTSRAPSRRWSCGVFGAKCACPPLRRGFWDRLIILAACSIALVTTVAGCGRKPEAAVAASANAATSSQIERVLCGNPQRKNLVRTTSQPARIEAFEETPLYAKLAGYVDTVHVDIGDAVKKDQALVTLRIPELHNEVEQKKALVTQAEAVVVQAEANIAAAEAASDTAAAHVAETNASVARNDCQS